MTQPRVVVLRGQQANPWELRPWEELADRFDVECLVTGSNLYELDVLRLRKTPIRALSDLVPNGPLRRFAARTPANRYVDLPERLRGAAVVHSVELGPWPSLQAAELKARLGYRLVVTVWETIPFRETYRNVFSRRYRRRTLAATDLFLPTTERARQALLLEGAPAAKIRVAPPGIDVERFGARRAAAPSEHVVLSPGRLVWEKGHQDVLRAVAALRQGVVATPALPRLLVVGAGPEERRLRRYARDLGIEDLVDFRRQVPYEAMPDVYAGASAVVLASLPIRSWEEQFGMVLAEAMAAGLPILASTSGAIPEVAGDTASYFAPGDWFGLARQLAAGPLARPPATRADHPPDRVHRYSSAAAAARLADAYESVLARS